MAMHPNTRAALNSPETRAKRAAAAKRQWENPETRAKLAAALNSPETRAKLAAARAHVPEIVCPKWVPGELVSEFYEIAAAQGEFEAARHIRRLKREMEAA